MSLLISTAPAKLSRVAVSLWRMPLTYWSLTHTGSTAYECMKKCYIVWLQFAKRNYELSFDVLLITSDSAELSHPFLLQQL